MATQKSAKKTETHEDTDAPDAQFEAEVEPAATVEEDSAPVEQPLVVSDLRYGVKDSDSVRKLQAALGVNESGTFGPDTMNALAAWQNKNGFAGGRGIQMNQAQADKLLGSSLSQ